jgi:serine/threonine protein phosphatase 1
MSSVRVRYPAPPNHKMINALQVNEKGRDFVCGDIHGSFSCVQKFLSLIKFDFTVDRLICAGDLVDRGPDNLKCLELLNEPWFFSVKGNHEELLQTYYHGQMPGMFWWTPNGGEWATKNATTETVEAVKLLLPKVEELPYLLTVHQTGGKKFHVIHAELFLQKGSDHVVTDETLADPVKFRELAFVATPDGKSICWGRHLFYLAYKRKFDEQSISGAKNAAMMAGRHALFNNSLSPIYSGHTVVRQPVQFFGQTNLDTMAYASYKGCSEYDDPPEWCGLTVTEPLTGKFWFVNDREFKEVSPVIIK